MTRQSNAGLRPRRAISRAEGVAVVLTELTEGLLSVLSVGSDDVSGMSEGTIHCGAYSVIVRALPFVRAVNAFRARTPALHDGGVETHDLRRSTAGVRGFHPDPSPISQLRQT